MDNGNQIANTGNIVLDTIITVIVGLASLGLLIVIFVMIFRFVFNIGMIIFGFAMIPVTLLFSVVKVILSSIFYVLIGVVLVVESIIKFVVSIFNSGTGEPKINKSKNINQDMAKEKRYNENDYYYLVLDLTNSATRDEVKKAYRKKVLEYHPDHNSSDDAKIKYQEVVEAYNKILQ